MPEKETLTEKEQSILLAELSRRKLELYRPYPKQVAFHNAGAKYRERLLMAGNQLGKTYCMAAEVAIHATGKYPEWWEGKRYSKAPVIWCAGVTGEVVRDTIQRLLIGDVANPGTGLIPPGSIVETMPSRGVADLVDTILVKHSSGSVTRIRLKYYEQGREKFQADTIDFGWEDEEPPEDIHMEFLTRTNATNGILGITFTPLKGMSKVVKRFVREKSPDRIVINMTIDDALHISPEKRQQIISSYKPHEQEARIYGKPQLGSGLIFPVLRSDITCDPFPMDVVPFYWLEIAGIDFAGSGEDGHPTAAVKLLYNPQDDIVYVTNAYRRKGGTPLVHGAALKPWGNVLFAWPHDGLQHDKGSGVPLKDLYVNQGLHMRPENARFEDGSNGVEAGLAMMLMRMETGKLKIFSNLFDLFEEIDSYYRQDGKIVKEDEDIICACLHPDTLVITDKGKRRIEDLIETEGRVLSIDGKWTDYKNCRMTQENAELVEVTYSDGHKLICTPDHKLLSACGEWVCAIDSLNMECHNSISCSAKESQSWMILSTAEGCIHSIVGDQMDITSAVEEDSYIGSFMKKIMGKFLRDSLSIISTVLKPIIFSSIYLPWMLGNICQCIKRGMGDIRMLAWPRSGNITKQKKVKKNLVKEENAINTICMLSGNFLVSIAETILKPLIMGIIDFAPTDVRLHGDGVLGLTIPKGNALFAQRNLESINFLKPFAAPEVAVVKNGLLPPKAKNIFYVSDVQPIKYTSNVYCMEVPKTNAFALANGAIVHNCRYAMMDLRYATRVKKPQGFINGYPIDQMEGAKNTHTADYNPLGHKYIDQILGLKR